MEHRIYFLLFAGLITFQCYDCLVYLCKFLFQTKIYQENQIKENYFIKIVTKEYL